jgi:ribose-phosphate pyrophosphokinase
MVKRSIDDVALISSTENFTFAQSIATYLSRTNNRQIRLLETEPIDFSDSDKKFKIKDHETVRGKDVYLIVTCEPPVAERLHELIVWIDSIMSSSAERLTVVMPYFFGSRQDRKSSRGESINIRAYLNAMKGAAGDKSPNLEFLTGDIHSRQSLALDMSFDNLDPLPLFCHHAKSNYQDCVVVSPDAGGLKRAEKFARIIGSTDIRWITKTRSDSGETNSYGLSNGDLNGKTVIIVDDIIDTARTLGTGLEAISGRNPKDIIVYAPHLVLSGNAEENLKKLEGRVKIIGTDTIYHPHKKLVQLGISYVPFSHVFAEAIDRKRADETTRDLHEQSVVATCNLEYALRHI